MKSWELGHPDLKTSKVDKLLGKLSKQHKELEKLESKIKKENELFEKRLRDTFPDRKKRGEIEDKLEEFAGLYFAGSAKIFDLKIPLTLVPECIILLESQRRYSRASKEREKQMELLQQKLKEEVKKERKHELEYLRKIGLKGRSSVYSLNKIYSQFHHGKRAD